MLNFLKKLCYSNMVITFLIASAHADTPIHIMPNAGLTGLSVSPLNTNIKTITKQALTHAGINIANNSPYSSINVQLIQKQSQRYLLAHLMSRYYFSYKIIRINLNTNNSIQYPVITNYRLPSNNLKSAAAECPAQYQTGKPLFVIGSPAYQDYKSVSNSINALSTAVLKTNQYQLVKLLDKNATVKNYQNMLACPNLKYFIHIGGSDDHGQFFSLFDGHFNATYFLQNPQLNLRDTAISLDSCNLFDQVDHGFCPILNKIKNAPLAYTAGSSQLLIYGSTETYACFWKKVLQGAPMTQSTLNQCAISYDPSVRNSQSGAYLIGDNDIDTQVLIQTNQRIITIQPNDYTVLKLNNGEKVTQYAMKDKTQKIVCSPDPTNRVTLLNNPNLTAGEFTLNHQSDNTCQFSEISRMQRNGGLTRDIYGFSPEERCFKLPNKPPIGLTISSNADAVDMSCNGLPVISMINSNADTDDWHEITLPLNTSSNLSCTFNLDKTKTEIGSMHLNIRPSATLPGVLSGQISDVKNRNGYPLPTITYSGKGDAQGYHNGVKIIINSK